MCVTCKTEETLLDRARKLQQHTSNVVNALSTINGIQKAGAAIKLSPAMQDSSDCLKLRVLKDLMETKKLTDDLLNDSELTIKL